jgi:hypothetical protein
VPLSREALAIIEQARRFARDGFLFPGIRKGVISDMTMSQLMSRGDEGTPARLPFLLPRLGSRGDEYAARCVRDGAGPHAVRGW